MALRQVVEMAELLDRADASGESVASLLKRRGIQQVRVTRVKGPRGATEFVRVLVPGRRGKSAGGRPGRSASSAAWAGWGHGPP